MDASSGWLLGRAHEWVRWWRLHYHFCIRWPKELRIKPRTVKKSVKSEDLLFITPILKSQVVPVIWLALIDAIYSRIAPFFSLNRIFSPANEETTLKTNNQSDFKVCLKKPIKLQENERQRASCGKFCNFCFQNSYFPSPPPPKMDELNFRPAQYCINKIFELTKSCIWAI